MTPAVTLQTDRLTLRGPVASDFEAIAAFYDDAIRSKGFGGPLPRDQAWRWFASMIGHWHLHGYGFWTVTFKNTNAPLGVVGLWNPEGWPEPELSWVMFDGSEGQGIAFEAATAARNYAYTVMGFETLTSNIIPGNDRSIALAERLGAVYETTYDNINMGIDMLYRHPSPAAVSV